MAGKCKTAAQMVALTMLLLLSPGASAPQFLPPVLFDVAKWLMVFSTALTVTSGAGYVQAAWPALMGKDASGKKK
jgi:phosphatidylglycerophosphate synthase